MTTPCREHTACVNRRGYGVLRYKGKAELAHRVAYCEKHGLSLDDIKGKVVRHSCDNPRCTEPEHLVIGTQAENVQDMLDRGRQRYVPFAVRSGTENPMSKLDYEKAKTIRLEYSAGTTQKELAARFGVSPSLISYVVTNKIWDEALGEVNALLSPIALTADGLVKLGFVHAATDKSAKLYHARDLTHICAALVNHINSVQARQAA